MHRAYSIILVVLLVVALAVPVFASSGNMLYNDVELPALPTYDESKYPYIFIVKMNEEYYLRMVPKEVYIENGTLYTKLSSADRQDIYSVGPQGWYLSTWASLKPSSGKAKVYSPASDVIWSNRDIYEGDQLFMAGTEPVVPSVTCDGTSCPATDINHDNICDDCGGVLTMSLRSSLLDFAKAQAESWGDTWAYYAVVAIGSNTEEYSVYMSNQPQVANVDGSNVVTSPNGLIRFQVTTKSDGSFQASGNYGAEQWVGNLVYSNHTIENFRTPPLAVIIQGVTGEAMETTLPNLHQTMKILALCGVGCLALLIGLKLFGKRSLLHLKK